MEMLSKIAAIAFAAYLIWVLFRFLKSNPESLSLANLNKSMLTVGLLAIGLIVFIAIVVFMLRNG